MDHLRTELVAHERMEEVSSKLRGSATRRRRVRSVASKATRNITWPTSFSMSCSDVPPETDLWKAKVKVLEGERRAPHGRRGKRALQESRAVLDRDELNRLGDRMAEIKRSAED